MGLSFVVFYLVLFVGGIIFRQMLHANLTVGRVGTGDSKLSLQFLINIWNLLLISPIIYIFSYIGVIINLLIYFLIGSIIGWMYGKSKKNNLVQ